jgi:hypothetical protein
MDLFESNLFSAQKSGTLLDHRPNDDFFLEPMKPPYDNHRGRVPWTDGLDPPSNFMHSAICGIN